MSERTRRARRTMAAERPRRRRSGVVWSVLLQVFAMIGIALLLYPDAADWFASRNHGSEIATYVERVAATPSHERDQIIAAGYDYNDTLTPGPLMDPYIEQNPDEAQRTAVYAAYEELLRVSGTDVIGTINYPAIGVALPIYHGTRDETISAGVGHLYGTSLPIGGPGTRAVLTSHSGLAHAKLFTSLLDATVGDQFWISVLGEDHYYEVKATETVLPGESESLAIIPGEDWVTLFTCAPIGVNSHRFMVHALRIDDPDATSAPVPADTAVVAGDEPGAGFPWWALWFVSGSGLVALVLFAPGRTRKKREDS